MVCAAVSSAAYIEQNLKKGAVIYLYDSEISSKPHYFVVVSDNPLQDMYLIMACATSQVEKRRASTVENSLALGTIVEVMPEEYPVFTKPTIFDCNYPVYRIKHFLIKQHKAGKLKFETPIPDSILRKICVGIHGSKLVETKYKKMVSV